MSPVDTKTIHMNDFLFTFHSYYVLVFYSFGDMACQIVKNDTLYNITCIFWRLSYTQWLKNDIDVAHYNFNAHQPILVSFGRSAAESMCYRMVISYPTSPK